MNTSPEAKYSIDPLPGDDWETRRAKQVARAVLAAKNEHKLTTEQLASICNRVLKTPDAIKATTLNGIFAGKRKSISTTELEMFSQALGCSVLDLLYPVNQQVELLPGKIVSSADALLDSLQVVLFMPGLGTPNSIFLGGRGYAIVEIARIAHEIEDTLGRSIYAIRSFGSEHSQSVLQMTRLQLATTTLHLNMRHLREEWSEEPPTLPATVNWALESKREDLSPDGILALEPLFAGRGQLIGDYRLGGSDEETHNDAAPSDSDK